MPRRAGAGATDVGSPDGTAAAGTPPARAPYTIVHVVAEYAPFARSGGLAEAARGLAQIQAKAGWPVVVFMPLYRAVREQSADLAPMGRTYDVWVGGQREEVRFFREVAPAPGPRIVFVDHPAFFNRAGLYGEHGHDYVDNARRFATFARAVLEGIPRLIQGPTLLHCHDWHTALVPAYIGTHSDLRARFAGTPIVMSVHNAGYQGHFPASVLHEVGLPREDWHPEALEWYGQLNFLKAGLVYSDVVVTVSPTHAAELRTPDGGFGLDGVFRALGERFTGICNGIDQDGWDPRTDREITAVYEPDALEGKERCKTALQRTFGLPQRKRTPVFGMTGRLVTQKGLDLIVASRAFAEADAQFIFLGHGEPRFEDALMWAARRRPDHIAVDFSWTERLEHRLMAGSDVFLMPSQYEPCGLTQMRAQRYATPVVGRRVGGIADTVDDGVTGFLFDAYDPAALDAAIDRAIEAYRDRERWRTFQRSGMARDFSWTRAAAEYAALYARALTAVRR
jgi:starch synthase